MAQDLESMMGFCLSQARNAISARVDVHRSILVSTASGHAHMLVVPAVDGPQAADLEAKTEHALRLLFAAWDVARYVVMSQALFRFADDGEGNPPEATTPKPAVVVIGVQRDGTKAEFVSGYALINLASRTLGPVQRMSHPTFIMGTGGHPGTSDLLPPADVGPVSPALSTLIINTMAAIGFVQHAGRHRGHDDNGDDGAVAADAKIIH